MFKNGVYTISRLKKKHRFNDDLDLIGDEEGLLLTSYQASSEHVCNRIRESLGGNIKLIEICCGVGGTTIFISKFFKRTYAIDISGERINFAKKNVKKYGNINNVKFIESEALNVNMIKKFKNEKINAILTDVEWRSDLKSTDLSRTTSNIEQTTPSTPKLYNLYKKITPNFVMHLAKNTDYQQLFDLDNCEVEELWQNGKKKFINVYFGRLIKQNNQVTYYYF